MFTVPANCFATFSAGGSRLFGVELMCGTFHMRRTATFPGDLALFFRIHCGKTPIGCFAGLLTTVIVCHCEGFSE
jgi:hypothetical protein